MTSSLRKLHIPQVFKSFQVWCGDHPAHRVPGQRRTKIHAELSSNGCAPKSAGSRRQFGDHPAGGNFHAVCSSNGAVPGQRRTTQGQPRPELRDASPVPCVVTDQGTEKWLLTFRWMLWLAPAGLRGGLKLEAYHQSRQPQSLFLCGPRCSGTSVRCSGRCGVIFLRAVAAAVSSSTSLRRLRLGLAARCRGTSFSPMWTAATR